MGSDIFGALFASVSGIDAQSTNLSIIANNIANANTIGYKGTQVEFETLVSGAGSNSNFASGGVTADNRQLVDQQGLLQSTGSNTDIAIQGNGQFVVNSKANGTGEVLYTRAGSFTQDSSGNFVNASGYYLQAWPLDSNGLLPGAPGNVTDTTSSANLSSLETVNVQNVAGKAQATTNVSLSANLNATQGAYPGSAGTVTMDKNNLTDFNIAADTVIVPDSSVDKIVQGDEMTIATSSNTAGYIYQYGGIAYSRNITTGAANGNSGGALQGSPTLTAGSGSTTPPFTFSATSPTTMVINENPATAGVTNVGQVVKLSGTTAAGLAVNNITSLDGDYYVTATAANSFTVTIPSNITPPSPISLSGSTYTVGANSHTIVVSGITVPTGLKNGDSITIAGAPDLAGLSGASNIDGTWPVSSVTTGSGGQFTITISGTSNGSGGNISGTGSSAFDLDGDLSASTATVTSRLFSGHILDADGPTDSLITTPSNFTAAALSFTVTVGSNTSTFTYTSAAPNASLGQFSTLTNLATAISDVSGLSARIVNNQLYISAVNGNDAITFANGSITGTSGSPPLAGIDWVGELGLANIAAFSPGTIAGRFSTLQGLANLVNASSGLTATVNNPLGDSTVAINVNDPLDTITFSDAGTGHSNTGSLLDELGLTTSLNGGTYAPQTAGPYGPAYDPTTTTTNMASGNITPQFSRSITVYDSLGASHNLNVAFINTGTNTWATEIYAQPPSDLSQTSLDGTSGSTNTGLVGYGTITFNGDGSLESVTTGLSGKIPIEWSDGAEASDLTINWGTAGPIGTGKTDGMSQFSSPFSVNFVNQNGAQVGSLTSVSIGTTGLVTASFSNGQTQNLYQIPIATFSNPNDLQSISGNVFSQTASSGQVNLQQAGGNNVGTIASSSLEQSNVQLADQLTNMIVAQQAYQANTKVISTSDTLLQALDQIIQ